ncbi:MAG TPA: Rne/Rng family ribonuclease [Candidatus Melainabacteria bacterium]|jgi:Rne/Rng family ribonuclease|nr:Rne/Rng family ribonuclease [Candidatus Melainabacteria bacterium]HIN66759.1 Rne/Rng family ribonuclease [Candidatus Obscuribacterales bacterium]
MKRSLVISEHDNIGAILENERVVEFFVNRGELLLGDIYTAVVENILPGIDAAFVNLGKDKMGFLHANDVPGQGPLKERLVPKQKLLVQITKEPTGHKGPRVSTAISLPGRFLVLVPEERGVSISRRISEARERARLKATVNLMKPPGVGLIIRTEAKGQNESELFDDFELLWDRWQTVVSEAEAAIGPALIYRDQDLLYRVIRDAYSHDVQEIIVDSQDGQRRAAEYLEGWASRQTKVLAHVGDSSLLVSKGVDREIEAALSDRVELPSGGHLNIQPTEALTVIDVNSGRFTSSRTQAETVRRTNLEAAQEISRQLRLRNIGGMVIVDFIDMDSRKDQQQVLENFQRALEEDRAKPQIGQLSDLGLVELTRRRQGQSLRELFTVHCTHCHGIGVTPTLEIGHGSHKTVIAFRPAEEDTSKSSRQNQRRNASQNRGGAVLRAATAMGGRVVPTVEVEEAQESFEDAMPFVPEEILDQVPDDLLDDKHSKQALKHGAFNRIEEDDDSEEGDVVDSEEVVELHTENFAPPSSLIEESLVEDDSPFHELDESISAVERVFNEMGESATNRAGEHHDDDEHEETETIIVIDTEAERPVLTEHSDSLIEESDDSHHSPSHEAHQEQVEKEEEEEEEEEEPATEIDPVTGIYRLKPKAKPEEEDATSSYEESSHGQHNNGSSEESAFQSAFTNSSYNYEKPFESSSYGQEVEQGNQQSEQSDEQYTQLTLAAPSSDEDGSDQQD